MPHFATELLKISAGIEPMHVPYAADIAVLYYAGHGMEVNGINYLVPVDGALARDVDVADETVSLDRVLRNRLRLVTLGACRDNQLVRSMRRSAPSGETLKNDLTGLPAGPCVRSVSVLPPTQSWPVSWPVSWSVASSNSAMVAPLGARRQGRRRIPAQCRSRGPLAAVPLGWGPSLHGVRGGQVLLVRLLHRHCSLVRVLIRVHAHHSAVAFMSRCGVPLQTRIPRACLPQRTGKYGHSLRGNAISER